MGSGARELAAGWQADQPPPGPAEQKSALWASSPDHDPRVTHALTHGATDAELAKIRAEVAAEYAQRAAEKAQRTDAYYGRDRMPAAMGAAVDERGVPAQRSVVHTDVAPLGSEVV